MKPTVPQVLPLLRQYKGQGLHIVIDDGNFADGDVLFCREQCILDGDVEGAHIATLLMQMSKTQRKQVAHRCKQ